MSQDLITDTRLNTNTRKAIVDCRQDVRWFQQQMHNMLERLDMHHDMMRGWNLNATRRILHTLEIATECFDAYANFIGADDNDVDADISIYFHIENRGKRLQPDQNPHLYPRSFYDRAIGDARVRGVSVDAVRAEYARGITDMDADELEHQVLCGCGDLSWMCESVDAEG